MRLSNLILLLTLKKWERSVYYFSAFAFAGTCPTFRGLKPLFFRNTLTRPVLRLISVNSSILAAASFNVGVEYARYMRFMDVTIHKGESGICPL